jgi:hypothetical protein
MFTATVTSPRKFSFRRIGSKALAAIVLLPLAGCASINAGGTYDLCTLDPHASAMYGNIGIQQEVSGGKIQWGFYPAKQFQGSMYRAKLKVGGKNKGGLEKPYPPHSSLPASEVKAGDLVVLTAESYRGSQLVLRVVVQCEG